MKLYEISHEIQRLLDGALDEETGEVLVDFEALDALVEAREAKLTSCGLHYLNRQAEMAAIKTEIDRLSERLKRLSKQNEGLLKYMELNLGGDEFSCPQFAVKYTRSSSVQVDDGFIEFAKREGLDNLIRVKHEPDKTAIGKLLKEGINLEHAVIVQKTTMKIK